MSGAGRVQMQLRFDRVLRSVMLGQPVMNCHEIGRLTVGPKGNRSTVEKIQNIKFAIECLEKV